MSDDVQRIVDELAVRLNRSVIVDTPSIEMRAVSRHFGDEDGVRIQGILQRQAPPSALSYILGQGILRWLKPGVIPASDELGMKRRLCCPIRWQGHLMGFMFIIDTDETLSAAEIASAEVAAETAAVVMFRETEPIRRERGDSEALIQQLISLDSSEVQAGLRRLLGGERTIDEHCAVVAEIVTVGSPEHRDRSELVLRDALEVVTQKRRDDSTALFRANANGATLLHFGVGGRLQRCSASLLTEIRENFSKALGETAEVCRVGTASAADLTALHSAHARAQIALQATQRIPKFGNLARWEDLGYNGVLLLIPDEALQRMIPPAVSALITADPSRELLRTVEAFLDVAGSVASAATGLHVHRSTLYYRLNRVEEITGLNLHDGQDRLTLHVGIKAAHLCGHS